MERCLLVKQVGTLSVDAPGSPGLWVVRCAPVGSRWACVNLTFLCDSPVAFAYVQQRICSAVCCVRLISVPVIFIIFIFIFGCRRFALSVVYWHVVSVRPYCRSLLFRAYTCLRVVFGSG